MSYSGAERIGGGRVLIRNLHPAEPGPALTAKTSRRFSQSLEVPGDAGTFLDAAARVSFFSIWDP
jgi:aldehyde dehydrogenase (NAD(P)+)